MYSMTGYAYGVDVVGHVFARNDMAEIRHGMISDEFFFCAVWGWYVVR